MLFIQNFIQYFFIFLFNKFIFILFNVVIVIFCFIIQSFFIRESKSDYINICSVNWFYSSLSSIQSYTNCSVNTNYINSISWFHKINMVFIGTKMKCLRCFSFRNCIWSFLHLNMLFIGKTAVIMHHFKCKSLLTLIAKIWFSNFSSFNKSIFLFLTFDTFKTCCFHFRNCAWVTNYNSL